MTTSSPFSSPFYLYLDTKTDAYPNFSGQHPREQRSTTFRFQTDDCQYFVDVIVIYADDPEATRHNVKIRIYDFPTDDGEETLKQTNFLPNDGRACSIADARRLADLHLCQALTTIQ